MTGAGAGDGMDIILGGETTTDGGAAVTGMVTAGDGIMCIVLLTITMDPIIEILDSIEVPTLTDQEIMPLEEITTSTEITLREQ